MDWSTCYREGNTPWEKGSASPPLLQWLECNQLPGRGFVPGCGFGHDAAAIAENGGAETVVGLDIVPQPVVEAMKRYGTIPGLSFVQGDLFALPEGIKKPFDWVFEHTCFCAIDPSQRAAYVEAVTDLLKPGGLLVGVFFIRPWDPHEDQSQGPPFGTAVDALDEWFGSAFEIIEDCVPDVGYPGREDRERFRVLRKR